MRWYTKVFPVTQPLNIYMRIASTLNKYEHQISHIHSIRCMQFCPLLNADFVFLFAKILTHVITRKHSEWLHFSAIIEQTSCSIWNLWIISCQIRKCCIAGKSTPPFGRTNTKTNHICSFCPFDILYLIFIFVFFIFFSSNLFYLSMCSSVSFLGFSFGIHCYLIKFMLVFHQNTHYVRLFVFVLKSVVECDSTRVLK